MAFPTTSRIFRQFINDQLAATALFDLSGTGVQSFKGALFNNSVTGTVDDTAAQACYAGSTWTGNEVSDTTGWAATGRVLDNCAITNAASGVVMWDCDDEVGGTITTGLTAFYGWMVYSDTLASPVADQGVCFNYFGGSNTASAGGSVTVVIAANGLFRITV